ncbi:MAG TPA: rhodanese-like domain-containing protein [Acidimicrobiales bacterium]|nr:rhodanese-like domain-containing protein [Acidimicrobiales bacterium]
MTSAIDKRIAEARARIVSVSPSEADALRAAGALFVDTRRHEQRDESGAIPGAIVIDRNVLEWRLDPSSDHRDERFAAHGGTIVVFCQQGYSSILAVAELTGLGVPQVVNLEGGFEAWAAAGLPVETLPVENG